MAKPTERAANKLNRLDDRHGTKPSENRKLRCAVYTRKSTEEGLDQEFNSLDAQREAAAAYILSQKHEGWEMVDDRYDDGGFSGGNTDRPALQRLLGDIEEGKVDIVVVYKVDRLTRSLADFAKLVELFDQNDASFVAVTQQFNTTTSMGRLTLNILLSFAQFEREVTSERIRDKFALAKQKGMWMGGRTALGYDVKERKLIINKKEAQQVRYFYELFAETESLTETCRVINREGYRTKVFRKEDKKATGGNRWTRATLHRLLKNRLYLGEITDKRRNKCYPGEHEAIIDQTLWDKVQAVFKTDSWDRRRESCWKNSTAFLQGIIFGPDGLSLIPSHTRRKGKLYRYYVASKGIRENYDEMPLPPVAADDIEQAVLARIGELLATPEVISRVAKTVWEQPTSTQIQEISKAMQTFGSIWKELYNNEQRMLVRQLVERIQVFSTEIVITLKSRALLEFGAQIPQESAA